jgi:hypothetical protein
MGVDIYGNSPRSPAGEYFCTNWSGWRPIAEFCFHVAPEITLSCEHWHSNDGDGLGDPDSIKLADALDREIINGAVDPFPSGRLARIREFAGFLRACGGFEIW